VSEPLDRNKSELTHTATATAAAWLDGLGCKPVETEVPVGKGWVADLATFWCPTMTEAKRSKLLRHIVPDLLAQDSMEALHKLRRFYAPRLTVVVEVKTSRADFLADRGRKYCTGDKWVDRPQLESPAHFCVLAAPASVLDKDRLRHWGHLRLSEDCTRVVRWEGPWSINSLHNYQIEDLIAAVAIRRDNVTRYASMRRWQKAYRAGGKA